MSFDHRFNELAKISLMMKMVTFKIQNMKTIFHDYVVGFKFKNNDLDNFEPFKYFSRMGFSLLSRIK